MSPLESTFLKLVLEIFKQVDFPFHESSLVQTFPVVVFHIWSLVERRSFAHSTPEYWKGLVHLKEMVHDGNY